MNPTTAYGADPTAEAPAADMPPYLVRDTAPYTDRLPAALLTHLVDAAGVFPPARLSLDEALGADAEVRTGRYAGLLGVFLCPSSRLDELAERLGPGAPLPVSAVVDAGGVPRPSDVRVDLRMVELAAPPAAALAALDEAPPGLPAYVEVPRGRLADELDALAAARADGRPVGGKVRCGGEAPGAVPAVGELAAFVLGCAERGLPFKATAGLHHAVRQAGRTGEEHGFLNLLLGCAAALTGGDVAAVLAEESAEALLALAPDDETARRVRTELVVSFGSCDLREPIEDLRRLGILD